MPPAIGFPFGIAAGMDGNLFVVDQFDDDNIPDPDFSPQKPTKRQEQTAESSLRCWIQI